MDNYKVVTMEKVDLFDLMMKHQMLEKSPNGVLVEDTVKLIERELGAKIKRPAPDSILTDVLTKLMSVRSFARSAGILVASTARKLMTDEEKMSRVRAKLLTEQRVQFSVPVVAIVGSGGESSNSSVSSPPSGSTNVTPAKRPLPSESSGDGVVELGPSNASKIARIDPKESSTENPPSSSSSSESSKETSTSATSSQPQQNTIVAPISKTMSAILAKFFPNSPIPTISDLLPSTSTRNTSESAKKRTALLLIPKRQLQSEQLPNTIKALVSKPKPKQKPPQQEDDGIVTEFEAVNSNKATGEAPTLKWPLRPVIPKPRESVKCILSSECLRSVEEVETRLSQPTTSNRANNDNGVFAVDEEEEEEDNDENSDDDGSDNELEMSETTPKTSPSKSVQYSTFPNMMKMYKSRARRNFFELKPKQRDRTKRELRRALIECSVFLRQMGLCLSKVDLNPVELDELNFKLTVLPPKKLQAAVEEKKQPNVNNLLFFKDKHAVSDKAYCDIRRICRLTSIPSIFGMKKRKKEIDSLFTVHNNEMGVFYSMRDKLKFRLESFFDRRYGVKEENDEETAVSTAKKPFRDEIIHVKLAADGTNIGRSLKLLNFTFTIINEGGRAKTATGNYTVGIFEIENESREAVTISFRELTDEIESIDEIEIRGRTVKIVFYYGGDWKMLANSLGIQAANSKYCCIWCKCSKDEYYDLDKEWSITDPKKGARTHEEQAAILNHPDYDKIVNYGCKNEPIFRDVIPISRYMIDMLHLFLRISDSLFNLLIKDCCVADGFDMSAISSFDVKKYKHMNSFQHFLNEKCNVKFSFLWIAETKKLTWRDLCGPEKIRMFENFNLAEIIPDHERFDDVVKIWEEFYEIVNLVKAVEMESSELKERTREWLRLYLSVYNKATVTPYMHAFVHHLHEFVFLYKDINAFNCQGLEKLNDITTTQYFKGTNKKDDAMHQILHKRNRLEYLADYIECYDDDE